eukprot:1142083-Pelagomonas_calceolata.AAC.1
MHAQACRLHAELCLYPGALCMLRSGTKACSLHAYQEELNCKNWTKNHGKDPPLLYWKIISGTTIAFYFPGTTLRNHADRNELLWFRDPGTTNHAVGNMP